MSNVTFDWFEFDSLVIEMNNLQELISVVNLYIAEEHETCGNAVSAIQDLTRRIYLDLLSKQKQATKAHKTEGGK
ncbi:hypothetical protein HYE53_04330 [Aggregatibacter actinomycetemcomitans]|uniref:hypothetical protein n=1 Tax=Aggregatibacter actinomycetemcomitans TaxID=714 RepID=UPI00197BF66E|nr:hypothetical protein [Aggregatibacter actinomycetemcomitans]MBN6070331.1 hypothetical protein [Aggregatibacter actinomycetemcomitans]MBN6075916.1 hypothetical protein [Aggregatibacter actinomycetemcomitans]